MPQIRWIDRFNNLEKAIINLNDTIICINENGLNKIYTMALIQAYEIAFELCWKTIKDYLHYNGIKVDTPREAIKEGFANNIITDGLIWIEMMEARNKTSHTYKEEFAKELASDILNNYYSKMLELFEYLKGKLNG